MRQLLLFVAVGLLVAGIAAALKLLGRRDPDEGDYERRLEELRRGGGLPGASGAAVPPDATRLERRGGELQQIAVPDETMPRPAEIPYPSLGRLVYRTTDRGNEWEAETGRNLGIPGRVTIVAGPDGPADADFDCIDALAENHAEILAQGIDLARQALARRNRTASAVSPDALRVGKDTPDAESSRGTVYLAVPGMRAQSVSVTTTDDWKSLHADVAG